MSKNRLYLMIFACLVLGVLVWMDNQSQKLPADRANNNPSGNNKQQKSVVSTDGVTTLQNPLVDLKKTKFNKTIQRPLFSPTRKAPQKRKKVVIKRPKRVIKPKPKYLNYSLIGVVLDDSKSIALLRQNNSGVSLRVEKGDFVDGWQVVRVEVNSITLQQDDGSQVKVQLFKN